MVGWCWFGLQRRVGFVVGDDVCSLFLFGACVCKLLEEHSFGARIRACEWYYWCFPSFTQHCNPLRRPLPEHLLYYRGIPISTYCSISHFDIGISVLHYYFTHPPWPIMVAVEGMRLRLCTRLGNLYFLVVVFWVVSFVSCNCIYNLCTNFARAN